MRLPPVPSLRPRSVLALAGAGALVALAAAPGMAAEPVAQSDATALVLTVASTPTDSGTVKAVHDGRRETVTGTQDPLITVLGNQPFINAGTLSQDATATVVQRNGRSAACAGLAGDGATLVSVDEGFCLTPGDNATINAGTFELGDVTLIQSDLLAGLDAQLQALLQPLLNPVLGGAQTAVQTLLTALGDPSVVLDLGTVQSQCTATTTGAEGDSQLTDAGLFVQFPAPVGRLALVNFPTNPPPNTKVLTDLDVVLETISDGLETQLTTTLGGILAPLGGAADQIVNTLNANIISAVADQLGPLEENILDVTLNKQTRGDRSIEVTALDLSLLPAAADFGVELVGLEIGRSSCGTNSRFAPPTDPPTDPPTTPGTPSTPGNPGGPDVPTSVPAGESNAASVTTDGAINGQIATVAIVVMTLLAAAGGIHTFRRVLGS